MNVLIVDDEPYVLEYLEYLIKMMHPAWDVHRATDSTQLMGKLGKVDFQLAFLDIELPGKSGLEIARILKNSNQSIDIIILTAHQDFKYAQASINIGVAAYITKPIIEAEVTEIINRFTEVHNIKDYSRMILETIEIIHKRFGEKLSLNDVAEQIHVNTSYLSRKFKQETGVPFSDYLNDYRIEMAKAILHKNNNYTISEVAEMTGFNSLHYFSSCFKKNVGRSPKEFQKKDSISFS